MEKQQFLNKFEELKSPANAERWAVLQLWLVEAKSDGEIAKALDKDRSTATRRIGDICKYFGTGARGKKEQRQHLVLLFRKYCKDFEVHPSVYPDWVDGDSSDRPQSPSNPQNIPTPESIPELTTLEFIGRDRDLTNLASLRTQYKIVLIKAGAGVGKSTLAREFLQTQFKKVIRIEMGLESGNVTPAEEKVSQILRKDFDEEPSRDFGINLGILGEKLADRTNPIGVLIDNLEPALDENYRFREKLRGYDALLAVLGDRDVFSFTLITSRRSLITPRARVHEYSLEGLDITAWRQYFHDCENGADSEALLQMCVAYNGNAKVMDILHGAIKNRFDGNIGAYWNRYKDALLADSELETLISVEMDWLQDNQLDAYKLLCRMGCYRYQDVKTVPFEGLICLLWDVPESRQACVVNYLSKTSLIEVKGEYYLHPAIRASSELRLKLNYIDYELANLSIAKFFTQTITSIITTEDALTAFEAYHHYLAISQYELASDVIVKRRSNAWEDNEALGNSFYRLGFLESIKFAIINISPNIPDSPSLCKIYNILGDVYWLTGEFYKSIDIHQKSKKLALEFSIANFEFVAFLNIGLCYIDLWEIQLAIDTLEKCIELSKNTIYRYHAIDAYFCLSFLYSVLQEKDKAIDFANKTLQEFNLAEHNTWSTGYRWLFLGRAYINLFDVDKSLEVYKKALSYAEESNYPQVKVNSLSGLSVIHRIQNNFCEAITYNHEAIIILENIAAKYDLAEAYFQLGLTYLAMREYDQAEEYKAKALELFAQMEAPKQIERVNKAFGGIIQ
ncbi:NB-ARC domain-containing protein [Pseudanabaena galeata UHCC 0370]|uniref:NB-ARC domain-containing protein n=1 Tax=Pseudanabaena galeata UHCC 0370 TaxID=3110310 RepID=A0ABU5TDS1_9CYAN|nr:NB-ARC domain-containing protein [Pseudanabaena galeata]MEA5476422.1 NB-ARC domain-containing protein [Pseudanabaena galeata UHCC 0370]